MQGLAKRGELDNTLVIGCSGSIGTISRRKNSCVTEVSLATAVIFCQRLASSNTQLAQRVPQFLSAFGLDRWKASINAERQRWTHDGGLEEQTWKTYRQFECRQGLSVSEDLASIKYLCDIIITKKTLISALLIKTNWKETRCESEAW
jgi:hypothetical protein